MRINKLIFLSMMTLSFAINHSGDITSDEVWLSSEFHLLTGQTFIKEGVTLTIEPGTTIYSNEDDGFGLAPA